MSISGALALYFIIWWLTLFAILPLGVRSQHEAGEVADGTEPGRRCCRAWDARSS